jgi:hypothetical protein
VRSKRSRKRISLHSARAVWQRVLLALTLIAVGFQSYALQTHIHLPEAVDARFAPQDGKAAQFASRADSGRLSASSKQNKTAPADDPANCPLCQEYLTAGNYVAPAAIAVLPPNLNVSAVALETRAVTYASVISHIWQGRAPPFA